MIDRERKILQVVTTFSQWSCSFGLLQRLCLRLRDNNDNGDGLICHRPIIIHHSPSTIRQIPLPGLRFSTDSLERAQYFLLRNIYLNALWLVGHGQFHGQFQMFECTFQQFARMRLQTPLLCPAALLNIDSSSFIPTEQSSRQVQHLAFSNGYQDASVQSATAETRLH